MTRIILTGTYNSYNKGDAAMQATLARLIQKRFGVGCVTIASPFPDIDTTHYAKITVPVIPDRRRRLVIATVQLCALTLRRVLKHILGNRLTRFLVDSEAEFYEQADLIVDLSGDMLTEDYGPHVAYSHFIPLLRATLQNRPFVICAQSIGPFGITRPLARFVLNKAAAITARDEITVSYLKSIGVTADRLTLTADMAFLLSRSPDERIDEILAEEKIELSGRPILGVSVSDLVARKFYAAAPRKRRNLPLEMARALDQIVDQHDVDVMFINHVTGPSNAKDDRIIAHKVMRAMDNHDRARVLYGDYRPEELKGIIARTTVFLGARMHANISALSSHVPVVAISYSHKTLGIMTMCGLAQNVIEINTLTSNEIVSKTSDTLIEAAKLRSGLKHRLKEVRQHAARNLDVIEGLLEQNITRAA